MGGGEEGTGMVDGWKNTMEVFTVRWFWELHNHWMHEASEFKKLLDVQMYLFVINCQITNSLLFFK